MKKYLLMLATLLAAMTAFTSCSDDDNNAPASPVAITDGEIPAKNFFLFVDGKYVATSLDTKTTISGTSSRGIENGGTLQLKSTAIYALAMDANGEFDKISPVIDLTVNKENGNYVLSGETTANGYTYTVTGEVTGNHAGENDYIIKVNRTKLSRTRQRTGRKNTEAETTPLVLP